MGRCVYSAANSPPNTKCTTFSRKLMLGKTLDGEFKLLSIRELDNDDVDDQPDSTDEDSPPNLANELWCSVERTLIASDEIQVNVMQKSVVYWKWPNVVDIHCKRADAIKWSFCNQSRSQRHSPFLPSGRKFQVIFNRNFHSNELFSFEMKSTDST